MRCPKLDELPAPPAGRKGWPWTDSGGTAAGERLPERYHPRVSIVTPSYNQGQFLEETIRSVLLQGYPDLEYMVIDGGSTDQSLEIIRKYDQWTDFWVCEPDNGQAAAINTGWRRSTGEILSWLNADDILLPGSLETTVSSLLASPEVDLVYGSVLRLNKYSKAHTKPFNKIRAKSFSRQNLIMLWRNPVPQPGFIIRRTCLEKIGYLDADFHFAMDFDYWVRLIQGEGSGKALEQLVAGFRFHENAKSSKDQLVRLRERYRIFQKFLFSDSQLLTASEIRHSKAAFHFQASRIAFSAGASRMMRFEAMNHIRIAKLRSTPLAWLCLLMSLAGDKFIRTVKTNLINRLFRP